MRDLGSWWVLWEVLRCCWPEHSFSPEASAWWQMRQSPRDCPRVRWLEFITFRGKEVLLIIMQGHGGIKGDVWLPYQSEWRELWIWNQRPRLKFELCSFTSWIQLDSTSDSQFPCLERKFPGLPGVQLCVNTKNMGVMAGRSMSQFYILWVM